MRATWQQAIIKFIFYLCFNKCSAPNTACHPHCLGGACHSKTNHPGAQWNHGPWELRTPGFPTPAGGRPCPYLSPRRQNVATASYKLSTKGLFHPGCYLCQTLNSTSHPGSKQNQGYFLAWIQGHGFLLTGKTL